MSAWHAVLCKPRREALAESNLVNQGYRVYLPRLATQRRRDGKWVDSVEPLFPRYLFLAAGNKHQGLAPVRSTLGVSALVRFGGQPASIPETVVESLRARQDPDTGACARRSLFKPGAPVEFRAGPFTGLDGVFDIDAGEDRVYVLLEFLGKLNKVKVCRDWLVPAI
jgi:transcriptional antiterminator RfaH